MKEEGEEEQKKIEEEPEELAEDSEEPELKESAADIAESPGKEEKIEEAGEEKGETEKAEEAAAPTGEEAKPSEREEKGEEEEIVEERFYTIPLGKAWVGPPRKRAARAMRIIRGFVTKHMKLLAREEGEEEEEPKTLTINNDVNERIWSRGIEKPPRKIRIRAARNKEGNITVDLAEGD